LPVVDERKEKKRVRRLHRKKEEKARAPLDPS